VRGKDVGFWVIIGGMAVGAALLAVNSSKIAVAQPAQQNPSVVVIQTGMAQLVGQDEILREGTAEPGEAFRLRFPSIAQASRAQVKVVLPNGTLAPFLSTTQSEKIVSVSVRDDYPPKTPPVKLVAMVPGNPDSIWRLPLPPSRASAPNVELRVSQVKLGNVKVKAVAGVRPNTGPPTPSVVDVALQFGGAPGPEWFLDDIRVSSLYGRKTTNGSYRNIALRQDGTDDFLYFQENMPYIEWMDAVRVQGRVMRTETKEELVDFGEVELIPDSKTKNLLRFKNPESVVGRSNLGLVLRYCDGDFIPYMTNLPPGMHLKGSFRPVDPSVGFKSTVKTAKPEVLFAAPQASVQLYVTRPGREEPAYTFMIRRPELKAGPYKLTLKLRRSAVVEQHPFDLRLPVQKLPLRTGWMPGGPTSFGSYVDPDVKKLFAK
jgi:hypothetical protein